jgi:hypothetical protein
MVRKMESIVETNELFELGLRKARLDADINDPNFDLKRDLGDVTRPFTTEYVRQKYEVPDEEEERLSFWKKRKTNKPLKLLE